MLDAKCWTRADTPRFRRIGRLHPAYASLGRTSIWHAGAGGQRP
jgi:hypothetical protein